jgi:hypothetical protein
MYSSSQPGVAAGRTATSPERIGNPARGRRPSTTSGLRDALGLDVGALAPN